MTNALDFKVCQIMQTYPCPINCYINHSSYAINDCMEITDGHGQVTYQFEGTYLKILEVTWQDSKRFPVESNMSMIKHFKVVRV